MELKSFNDLEFGLCKEEDPSGTHQVPFTKDDSHKVK